MAAVVIAAFTYPGAVLTSLTIHFTPAPEPAIAAHKINAARCRLAVFVVCDHRARLVVDRRGRHWLLWVNNYHVRG